MPEVFNTLLGASDGASSLTLDGFLLRLLSALVLGQVVAWIYIGTRRGVSYTATVAQAAIVMALIVTLVMAVVGNSLARAFGLFGALALIRFRTPVKDARDTVFLFFAVAIGIACGTGNLLGALAGTVVIGGVLWYLSSSRFGTRSGHDGLLRLRMPAAAEAGVKAALDGHCAWSRIMHMRELGDGSVEYAWQFGLQDLAAAPRLLADVRAVEGAAGVSVLLQDAEELP